MFGCSVFQTVFSVLQMRWKMLGTGSSPLTHAIHPNGVPHVNPVVRRIHGWSWQAFPVGMGTGAVYVVLSDVKAESPVREKVVVVFYFINIALFLFNTGTLLLQAIMYPRHALSQLQDPEKCFFVPLIVLSFATIVIGTAQFAVPTGPLTPNFIYALFWCEEETSSVVYYAPLTDYHGSTPRSDAFYACFRIHNLPAGNIIPTILFDKCLHWHGFNYQMLIGVVSFHVLKVMNPADGKALGVLLVGYFFQGLGFFTTLFYICIYVIRLTMVIIHIYNPTIEKLLNYAVQTGIPEGQQANGAFICCGPPGFTALALIELGAFSKDITANISNRWRGLLLLGFAIFFFIFGALPYWFKIHKNLHDILGCWALTFPNVGWISTVNALGEILEIQGLITLHLIMAIGMCLVWIILFVLTVIAFLEGDIFTSKDEDVLMDSRPNIQSMDSSHSSVTQTSRKTEV
ncbi:voltage-dependent anion channel-domain-containing protein [Cyathus striatus]|nr:voltage-dependent anion channel-domain-containing protein [Cyathus striatus]